MFGVYLAQVWQFDYLITVLLHGLVFRIIMNIGLSIPANFIAFILKRSEKVDVYDHNTDFNPFHFSILYKRET